MELVLLVLGSAIAAALFWYFYTKSQHDFFEAMKQEYTHEPQTDSKLTTLQQVNITPSSDADHKERGTKFVGYRASVRCRVENVLENCRVECYVGLKYGEGGWDTKSTACFTLLKSEAIALHKGQKITFVGDVVSYKVKHGVLAVEFANVELR